MRTDGKRVEHGVPSRVMRVTKLRLCAALGCACIAVLCACACTSPQQAPQRPVPPMSGPTERASTGAATARPASPSASSAPTEASPKGLPDPPSFLEPVGGATCQGEARCPGERPICFVAPDRVACVSAAEAETAPHDGRHFAFACSRGSDCDGALRCCTGALGDRARCAPSCDVANELELCGSDQECALEPARCVAVATDEGESALPPWVKACQTEALDGSR